MNSKNFHYKTKITIKNCGLTKEDIQAIVADTEAPVAICRVLGKITGHTLSRAGIDDEKAIVFLGQFEGTNISSGEVYRSDKMILPNLVSGSVKEAFDNVNPNDGSPFQMMTAFDIYAEASASAAVGYSFSIVPLVKEASDPFEELKSGIPELPALPA